MAVRWRFQDYETKDGEIPIRDWYKSQTPQVRSAFDTTVRHLSVTEVWTVEDGAKTLTGRHAGLTELMIDIDEWAPKAAKGVKRRFRPIGLKNSDEGAFLLFGGCEKLGGVLNPLSTFDDAIRRWREWERGMGKVHDHDV